MAYIILKDGTKITINRRGPQKTAIATDNTGKIIFTGSPSISASDKVLLEEAAIALSPNATLDNVLEEVLDDIPQTSTQAQVKPKEDGVIGTPTGSYANLNNGYRVEIYKDGVRKQAVIRDKQGNIVYTSEPKVNVKDDDMLNIAVKILNKQDAPPELDEAEGTGYSPSLSFAKELAISDALDNMAADFYTISNWSVIDEKAFQLENGSYKYTVKIKGTITPK